MRERKYQLKVHLVEIIAWKSTQKFQLFLEGGVPYNFFFTFEKYPSSLKMMTNNKMKSSCWMCSDIAVVGYTCVEWMNESWRKWKTVNGRCQWYLCYP